MVRTTSNSEYKVIERNLKEKLGSDVKVSNNKITISDNTQTALFTANALLYEFTKYSINKTELSYNETIYLSYLDWLQTQTSKDCEKKAEKRRRPFVLVFEFCVACAFLLPIARGYDSIGLLSF